MCIGFPGKILSINEENFAIIDIGGTQREICLDVVDEDVAVGDYVICHAGFALHRVDEDLAHEKLTLLHEIMNESNGEGG
ncbi:MAG: HypC/HybG/HupF family hydrogenase formation chaperone [Deltaproteobacteria bacterium]|nr:HypC/HybG/HupF family hydrogenase formation chaperone [Deltaproteobacteria bacterium]